ncbi:MAG: hypothetical protein ACFFG0_27670 [Candidatus Thorarchaeota archaeon]
MIDSLDKIFGNIELSWIDSSTDIVRSEEYNDLFSIFSNLEEIFQAGIIKDEDEFHRTIRHVFRLFKIFFLIKSGNFVHDTLSPACSLIIREKILNQISHNESIIPIILMYHDIGRLDNKKEHPYYSYHIITEKNMLESFNLTDIERLLIMKVIQYHLLFATIYTGESTFYGIYSILNDIEFDKLFINKEIINRFIDLLEIFTYIDILGYSYARIYDHYINYYDEINIKLKNILKLWPNKETALKKAMKYSQDWIEWRLAGALRIFQYVNTEPYLTEDFYFSKIKESIDIDFIDIPNELEWEAIKENHLVNTNKIQMKYGLGILMLLAFGKFFRGPLREDGKISTNLIIFWILLSKEIANRANKDKNALWNIHFLGIPNWLKWDRIFKKELNYSSLKYIIQNSNEEFNIEKREFNLYLDFSPIFN